MQKNHELFKSAANFYNQYRPQYPKECFTFLKDRFKLNGEGELLDLGCGTGFILDGLYTNFEHCLGVDPSVEMLAEANKNTSKLGITNASFLKGSSENLLSLCGNTPRFKLVTIGKAFHWMDHDTVLKDLYRLISPNGGIAILSDSLIEINNPNREKWLELVESIENKYISERQNEGKFSHIANEEIELPLSNSAFTNLELKTFEVTRQWTIDSILGFLYSTADSSPDALGNKREQFENEIKNELLKVNPKGEFSETVIWGIYTAFK